MISTKAAIILLFITLNMQRAATSSSDGTQEPSPSGESAPLVRKRRPILKSNEMLADASSTVKDVEVHRESAEETSTSHELSVPQANKEFEKLIEQRKYDDVVRLAVKMNMKKEEFMKQLCLVVKTPEQYRGFVKYLKKCKRVASFYVCGDIEVIKGVIVESGIYVDNYYVKDGDLEIALPLALENDNHDRFIKLLDARKEATAEEDGQRKLDGIITSFERFLYHFLNNLAPWENGMTLRRFLILRGEELRTKYPDILDMLCQELMIHLHYKLDEPKSKRLLVDIIGQPSLLTPVIFAGGFLKYDDDGDRSSLIKYGWREIIQESLKAGYLGGGEKLWRVMQKEKPKQFPGVFPATEKARVAACAHLPTKQQREDEWIKNNEKLNKKNALILYNKLEPHGIFNLFPGVLWTIITEYAT